MRHPQESFKGDPLWKACCRVVIWRLYKEIENNKWFNSLKMDKEYMDVLRGGLIIEKDFKSPNHAAKLLIQGTILGASSIFDEMEEAIAKEGKSGV